MKKTLILLLLIVVMAQTVFAAEQVLFYHTDPAGTPLSMTNTSGTVVWKADYKPFGEEQSVTATAPNDKRFVGKEKDEETGLSYFGARYENAKIGRFIAPDPVRAVDDKSSKTNEKILLNPQRLNTYAYALNNPYRYVDPDGREPLSELGNRMVTSEAFIRFGEAIGASQLNAALTGYDFRGNESSGFGRVEQLGIALMNAPNAGIPSNVQKNFARFVKKIPANSKSSAAIEAIEGGGYRFSATSSGEVPGSKAIYQKTVDAGGNTTGYLKTTVDPKGQIVHVKNKIGQ